jgi:hypothetical protein
MGRPWDDTLMCDGAPIDLTAKTVKIRIKKSSGTVEEHSATIRTRRSGTVRHWPHSEDVDTAGETQIEWKVYDSSLRAQTVPTDQTVILDIQEDIR